MTNAFAIWEFYIIYLRKSRQDDPRETVEEVLAKHEAMLQEYAQKEFGGKIPESNIYREVVSGESIEDREEIKKVLARIEDPMIRGVLVVEPSRLSRGDLEDCGRLISDFRYTRTQVVTPYMTYDLENKMERKFFQDELLRGRDYLEYTKEILFRGRIASVKRGCYLGTRPPYGYKKVKIGKDHTLEIVEEEAAVVRLIFDMYAKEGITRGIIANRLTEMGIKAPKGEKWGKDTVRFIIRNRHYIGKVVFNRVKATTVIENGEKLIKRLAQDEEDILVADGLHEPIIDEETWEAAQKLVARHPRTKHAAPLKNPFSTILVCGKCGRSMNLRPYAHAAERYECRKSNPRCYKSIVAQEVYDAVLIALEEAELPALKLKVKNDDGNAMKIQQKLLETLEDQLKEFTEQEDKQFELLETGVYTQDVFERRHHTLHAKMEECKSQIYQTKMNMPKAVDYAERVEALENAIAILKDPNATPDEQNKLLRVILEKIEFYGAPSSGADRKGVPQQGSTFTLKVFLRI
jgi:DNA invertase Pin-like site-specific DNA recombinase